MRRKLERLEPRADLMRTPRGAPCALESERLSLRAPDPAYGPVVAAGVAESFDELHRWMEWAVEIPTPEAQTERQARTRRSFLADEEHSWLLFRREDEEFVGICGLPRPRWEERVLEIGYWLRTSWVGHGYMTEAVRRLTTLCFEELGALRVEIHVSDQNRRSFGVAERAGYELVETRWADSEHPDGSLRNTRIYARECAPEAPHP